MAITVNVTVNASPTPITVEVAAARDAYQLALAEGYAGTREQWLASLQGPPGPAGGIGATGPTGPAAEPWDGTIADIDLATPTPTTEALADGDFIMFRDVSGTPANKTSLISRVWDYIKSKIDAGQTWAGNHAFSSSTRPTSSGTGLPEDVSLVTRTDAETVELFGLSRIRRHNHSTAVANGGTATANQNDGDVLTTLLAANARPAVYSYRLINAATPSSSQAHYVVPVRISSLINFVHHGTNNPGSRIRFTYGVGNASVPAGDANALVSNGFGWEIYWNGSQIVIGLFAFGSGGYVTTDGSGGRASAVPTGLTAGVSDNMANIIIGLASNGTVTLWASFAGLGTALGRPSHTPLLTLSGGPVAGLRYASGAYPIWSAANHSTNVATTSTDVKIMNRLLLLD